MNDYRSLIVSSMHLWVAIAWLMCSTTQFNKELEYSKYNPRRRFPTGLSTPNCIKQQHISTCLGFLCGNNRSIFRFHTIKILVFSRHTKGFLITKLFQLKNFLTFIFISCIAFLLTYVCAVVSAEARREHLIYRYWSSRQSWVTIWLPGIEPIPSGRAVRTLNCWAISSPDTWVVKFKLMKIQLNFTLKSHLLLALVQFLRSHTTDSSGLKGNLRRPLLELARCLSDREYSISVCWVD